MSSFHAKPLFSINEYDDEGDLIEKVIYLHFGDVRIKVADSPGGLDKFMTHLEKTRIEINKSCTEQEKAEKE